MAKERDGEEPDYLAGTQPKLDPAAFAQVVRQAFELEFGTTKDQHIADIIGRDSSRVSQILKHPERAESVSIKHLVSFLGNSRNRERIVLAWKKAYFPEASAPHALRSYVGKKADGRALRRMDALIRENQLQIVLTAAWEASRVAEERGLREAFRDRAYFAAHRLDRPGTAMLIARTVAVTARREGDLWREAAALTMRARILLGLADADPDEIFPALGEAARLLEAAGPAPETPYLVGRASAVATYRLNAAITMMERGRAPVDADAVKDALERSLAKATGRTPKEERFHHCYLAARCHLLLGETFQAQELLEKAYRSVSVARPNLFELAGLLCSRIMAASDPEEEREEYLLKVAANCRASGDAYHLRLAEWDLARLEARLFPAFRPDRDPG